MSRVSAEKAELANQRKGVKAALREARRARERARRERARGEFYELLDEDLSGPTEGGEGDRG